ncbi:MAG: hypothetical protein HKM07_03415 [Chlamydiae bacterium]|jgi:hypothetical protein|nr:hypothetical protein [Chlamydiota bacterium]
MRLFSIVISAVLLGSGLYWVSTHRPEFRTQIEQFLDGGQFHTLEIKYNAKQLMEHYRRDLLKDTTHTYMDPSLKFYPYLLLEVKYNLSNEKTREGVILWDLCDGEMVVDTSSWEKTHGFGDCINANTEKHEFKILNILARKGGMIDRDGLSKALQVENEILNAWVESCRKKKLIVQTGNHYRLHLQNPNLRTIPETRISEWLVTKPYKNATRLPRKYSLAQIQKIAKAAFGNDFVIRQTTDVYLPVHSITVQNPDGSTQVSHWNAVNGKRLSQMSFSP